MINLERFLPGGAEVGVGLALKDGEDFIFFLPGSRYNLSPGRVFFAGIGGHLEPGETYKECALREAREEAGLQAEVLPSSTTFFISRQGKITSLKLEEEFPPWILYTMVHPPETPREGKEYYILIFKARLLGLAGNLQEEEIGGLLALPGEKLLKSMEHGRQWKELKKEGARIIAGDLELAENTVLYPLGTARALVKIFKKLER